MNTIPSHVRKKLERFCLVFGMLCIAWLLQTTILTALPFHGVITNLPLTVTAVTGFIFGSPIPTITMEELRSRSTFSIFLHQLARGSVAGALTGACAAALFSTIAPIYPVSLPLVGWILGYFCIRGVRQETMICIPIVFLATVLNDILNALQFSFSGYRAA